MSESTGWAMIAVGLLGFSLAVAGRNYLRACDRARRIWNAWNQGK